MRRELKNKSTKRQNTTLPKSWLSVICCCERGSSFPIVLVKRCFFFYCCYLVFIPLTLSFLFYLTLNFNQFHRHANKKYISKVMYNKVRGFLDVPASHSYPLHFSPFSTQIIMCPPNEYEIRLFATFCGSFATRQTSKLLLEPSSYNKPLL